ncbi:mitochondrial dicarboxylate carrier-like isoform X3 [Ornithorhynchus anatinus]|uniref:mitochondrial dicarboxylate carrier-like isoform X3 n=1 Tax=Ornithorhynchus anatinus TaxID=9258 RepID=UPI0010A8B6D1|nr:mitochondrial dicarboxylate carrier-like isoform X3 [Ornithorhynchus anatinus]
MPEKRVTRWYFGGVAACGAACVTHPLDLLKVHLQTQQKARLGFASMAVRVVSNDGFLALYCGLSASVCRQLTYSLTRFAIYDTAKDYVTGGQTRPLPFYQKVLLAAVGGFAGGFVGSPAEMVNVRMQNDVKLPLHLRRNYAHALHGLSRIIREEGFKKLYSGATLASSRGALVTVGQGVCTTFLCQPIDVVKTRLMNSRDYEGVLHCAMETAKLGPLAFYKGLFPAAIRLMPQTVLTFIFLEQLRKNFGIVVANAPEAGEN